MEKSNFRNQFYDDKITMAVKSRLFSDGRIPHFDVEVATKHGIVYLSGEVDSEDTLCSAIEIAYATNGVKDVHPYNLKVIPDSEDPIEDGLITAKVKMFFLKEGFLGHVPLKLFNLNVNTINNIVYLRGETYNESEAVEALRLVQTVKGVKEVKNKIEYHH